MAESKGTNRFNDHEQRLAKLEAARKELEDSFIVMAHLETKAVPHISKSMLNLSPDTNRLFKRLTQSLTR